MGFRVLVVDDATFVRDAIKRNLRQLIPDLEVFEAPDGRKACSLIKTKNIRLILSDWEMPEMSGEELLSWLREQGEYQHIPFVMVTSRGDRDNVIAAVNAGVSDYVTKPFTAEEIQRKVAKQLKRLGYRPPSRAAVAASQGAFSSLDVLTGKKKKAEIQKPREVKSASGFAKAPKGSSPPRPANRFQGKAYLRLASGTLECIIRDLSLQALSGVIQREDSLPSVFDQAAIDLVSAQGAALARLNGYVHGVIAIDPHPECQNIKISIRFVDDDPAKMEVLSKVISGDI